MRPAEIIDGWPNIAELTSVRTGIAIGIRLCIELDIFLPRCYTQLDC
jgi:hypothetical protein